MTSYKKLLAFSSSLCLLYSAPLLAQDQEEETEDTANNTFIIDEIVVTARKREENLQDIPVSISVLGADTLAEQNVLRQADLADLIPGYYYNEGGGEDDRIAALPSIRGIGASEIATNRTKVSSFVDGIPIIGNIGAISIGSATQVEVFNGPQSAAFGRSTFAGAINYVTQDPGDEIEGSVGLNWSDQGTRIVTGSVGGPLVEGLLGFQLGGSYEDSEAPDDFYTFSDGTEAGTQTGDNFSARFVFTPTDNFTAKLTFAHDATYDGPNADFYATQESAQNCFDNQSVYETFPAMGMDNQINVVGAFDCELERDTSANLITLNDVGAYYEENIDAQIALVGDATAAAAFAEANGYTLEEALILIADAYSVQGDVGSTSERDRIILQTDYLFDNDSLLQFSYMESEEEYIRDYITSDSATPHTIVFDSVTPGAFYYGPDGGMGMADVSMADPTTIDETYAELRWASPAEERIRYVVGTSYYQYDFITEIFFDGNYNALQLGTAEAVETLTGENVSPGATLSETTENLAAFFNVSYDFSDKITGSIEGRYSSDEVGAVVFDYSDPSNVTENNASVTTKSFTPRLALNYNLNDDTTFYVQYAIGVNPAGLNSDFVNPANIASLDDGYLLDLDRDGVQDDLYDPQTIYAFDSSDYATYDEETLTNYEFGFKGSALDGRLSYAGALYFMEWEDATQSINIDWEHPDVDDDFAQDYLDDPATATLTADGLAYIFSNDDIDTTDSRITANAGTSQTMGIELQGSYRITDNWSVSGNTSLMQAEYTDYCSFDDYSGFDREDPDVFADVGHYAGLEIGETEGGDPCYVFDGLELQNQPAFTLSLSPSYRTELGNGIGFSATSRFQYTDSTYTDYANIGQTPSTFRVNLTFGLSWEQFSGSFYIQNLLDDTSVTDANLTQTADYSEIYPDNAVSSDYLFNSPSGTEYSTYSYRIPTGRNFGMRLNYRF